MSLEIRQCAMCGADASLASDEKYWYVECNRCCTSGPKDGYDSNDAVGMWNVMCLYIEKGRNSLGGLQHGGGNEA